MHLYVFSPLKKLGPLTQFLHRFCDWHMTLNIYKYMDDRNHHHETHMQLINIQQNSKRTLFTKKLKHLFRAKNRFLLIDNA